MEYVMDYAVQYVLKFFIQEKYLRNQGLPKFALGPPPRNGLDKNFGRP
jgi:hypothetical protein